MGKFTRFVYSANSHSAVDLDLKEQIKKYVAELQSEMVELIHADPQTPEERHQVLVLRKRVVDTVLKEARVDQNRRIHIKFRSDFTARTNSSISIFRK